MAKSGRPRSGDTRDRILAAADALARSAGLPALTFEAVARALGLTKQAVIYWFPTKDDLLAAVALPHFEAETAASLAAMRAAAPGAPAIAAFVMAATEFHLADLDRFRLVYVAPHIGAGPSAKMPKGAGDRLHALTGAVYSELQAHLAATGVRDPAEARRRAVAIDMAVCGLATMVSLTQAMGDPLLHDPHELAASLARMVAGEGPVSGAGD